MVLIPFIYFTLLTLYWWKKHLGFDICVYMSGLYALITFCTIPIVYGDLLDDGGILFDRYDLELGLAPTILFCGLITLAIFPFSLIYRKDVERMKAPDSLVLECFCWLLFAVSLVNMYLIGDSTAEILSGDMSTVRMDHYEGVQSPAEVKAESMPIFFGYIFYFRFTTILALPLFFYYTCFSKKPWWFLAMLFLTSLTMPLYGIQVADRTEFVFYALMAIYCLIFFWKFLTKKFKRGLAVVGAPLALLFISYLAVVSQDRFSGKNDDNEKVYEALLQYAGQSYLNFCYFWENGKFDKISSEREFPFTNHVLYHVENSPERRAERFGEQGFFMSVFASFAGDVMLDLSPIGAIFWTLAFFLLSLSTIRYAHREEFDASDVLAVFALAVVPLFGLFYYRYYDWTYIFMFSSVIVIYYLHKRRIVFE